VAEIIGNTDNVEAAKREIDALVDVIRRERGGIRQETAQARPLPTTT